MYQKSAIQIVAGEEWDLENGQDSDDRKNESIMLSYIDAIRREKLCHVNVAILSQHEK